MRQDEIEFDRYQRFKAVARLVEELAGSRRLEILDVGSLDNAFAGFVSRHQVRPWDQHISSEQGGLPLPDGSMDMAVALDVLEHVAPDQRRFFISEVARVSRLASIIAFPIAAAAQAEQLVLRLTGSPWLAEHQQYGLPQPERIEAIFSELGLGFTRHPNACLPSWTAMMLLMYGAPSKELQVQISQFFNRNFSPVENREPAYRYIYVVSKQD